MAVSDKLQLALNNKQAVKQALIDQGSDPTDDFSTYGMLVAGLETISTGQVQLFPLGADTPGYLLLDGSTYYKSAYPELGAMYPDKPPVETRLYIEDFAGLPNTDRQAHLIVKSTGTGVFRTLLFSGESDGSLSVFDETASSILAQTTVAQVGIGVYESAALGDSDPFFIVTYDGEGNRSYSLYSYTEATNTLAELSADYSLNHIASYVFAPGVAWDRGNTEPEWVAISGTHGIKVHGSKSSGFPVLYHGGGLTNNTYTQSVMESSPDGTMMAFFPTRGSTDAEKAFKVANTSNWGVVDISSGDAASVVQNGGGVGSIYWATTNNYIVVGYNGYMSGNPPRPFYVIDANTWNVVMDREDLNALVPNGDTYIETQVLSRVGENTSGEVIIGMDKKYFCLSLVDLTLRTIDHWSGISARDNFIPVPTQNDHVEFFTYSPDRVDRIPIDPPTDPEFVVEDMESPDPDYSYRIKT